MRKSVMRKNATALQFFVFIGEIVIIIGALSENITLTVIACLCLFGIILFLHVCYMILPAETYSVTVAAGMTARIYFILIFYKPLDFGTIPPVYQVTLMIIFKKTL